MACAVRRLRIGSALPLGCALAALCPAPAAASNLRLFTPDTLEVSGDVRLVAVNGEKSGSTADSASSARAATAISGPVRSSAMRTSSGSRNSPGRFGHDRRLGPGRRADAGGPQPGLSQLQADAQRQRQVAFSARAGLMWPPVSLEHEGADWHVADSITPSAINSWIGEEVRPVPSKHDRREPRRDKLRATAAVIAANDTAGTLLTFRGWALHDRTTLAFNRWPLPPLGDEFTGCRRPSPIH